MLTKAEENRLRPVLRQCQREAIKQIEKYLDHDHQDKSMLVCMPTGSGKTGVIATICQQQRRSILVLSPRTAVCDQLRREVAGNFFKERGIDIANARPVSKVGSNPPSPIVIDTFQKLVSMEEEDRNTFLERFDLVIVDEGHSEPAPTWGRIVRSMKCKKVIVTATPYRNDLFQFNIGGINYGHTFKNAVSHGDVLDPEFSVIDANSTVKNVASWLKQHKDLKCIIKCKEFEDTRRFLRLFRDAGVRALAFHDQFARNPEPGAMTDVPQNVASREERVLIHQHKLDEGVDIPNAKLLVLTYAVSNGRELVQATGRIVRKSSGDPQVWDCSRGSNSELWKNYREFDTYISGAAAWDLFLKSLDSATLINAYLSAFPKISYYGQTFRSTFDIEEFDPDSQLKLPLASVCFMNVDDDFEMPSFLDTMLWELRGKGELVRLCSSSFGLETLISVTFDTSKYLKNELFFQPRIEVLVAKLVGRKLALLDSRSIDHSSRKELKTGRPIDVTALLKLAARGSSRRTRETHARAVSTTRNRAEGVALRGANLEGIVATQTNANYSLSIAKVDNYNENDQRDTSYYLGIGSGRVSDQKFRNFSLERLSEWIDDIVEVMDAGPGSVGGLLSSFALPLGSTPPSEVLSVTIDLSDLETEVVVRRGDRDVVLPPGFHFEKVTNHKLSISGIPLALEREEGTERLCLSSSEDLIIVSDTVDAEAGTNFIEWLNGKSLKALLDDGVSYLDGRYYMVQLPTQHGFDLTQSVLGRQIVPLKELQSDLLEEKGSPAGGRFATNSIFNLIDELTVPMAASDSLGLRRMKGEVADADIVLCTDLGTEAADFIISSEHKLIYIHAKCGTRKRPNSSAGALAEVGSQAIKNIELLVSKDISLQFGNETLLSQPWPSRNSANRLDRIRLFKDGAGRDRTRRSSDLRDMLELLALRRRSDACEKEVWVVVGRSFSFKHFVSQLAKGSDANSETLQALQLLSAWSAAARDSDVTLKLYVSP